MNKGEVEGLGSRQSGSTGQKVLIRKRDGRMRLLARRDFMMMIDDDDSGLFGNLGLSIFLREFRRAYKQGRGGGAYI